MSKQPMNDQAFAQFLMDGQLMGARCSACQRIFLPPRLLCPECHVTEMEWQVVTGTGRLVAFTSISIGPPWMIEHGFDRNNPYCTGVVELDDGPRVVARLDSVDAQHPDRIKIGTPLKIKLDKKRLAGSKLALVFVPR